MIYKYVDFFEGKWIFTRKVAFKKDISYATANGLAHFTSAGDGILLYSESGTLNLMRSTIQTPFYKNYIYEFLADYLKVYFADDMNYNKLYQTYKYSSLKIDPIKKHICNLDVYTSNYLICNGTKFTTNTLIAGPEKDYNIITDFFRM